MQLLIDVFWYIETNNWLTWNKTNTINIKHNLPFSRVKVAFIGLDFIIVYEILYI